MAKHVDIPQIYKTLKAQKYHTPIAELVEAQTKDPEKVLMATILSARTKDETTAAASRRLFSVVDKIKDLRKVSVSRLEKLIYPVGFYKTKARHLKALPAVLDEKFGGKLPQTVEALCELPGVGRKTANLVVAVGFHKPAVCVDVHVHRIMNRLGYVKTDTPYETEMAIRKKMPEKYWEEVNSLLVAHGQAICGPVSPWCSMCSIKKWCNRNNVGKSR